MRRVLITWIGNTDLRARENPGETGIGPIAQALADRPFDEVHLLTDYPADVVESFVDWLRTREAPPIRIARASLSGPTAFGEIYEAAARACDSARGDRGDAIALTFHLSPGTPAMAAVWILLAKTRFPAELIESSRQHGVRTASVPFDISAEFLPDPLRDQDERLRRLSAGPVPEAPEFADIVHRSRVMARLIERAHRVAQHNVPVLIEGPSGTGKELLARAIHRASRRRDRPFIAVNCGAIPSELVESELFGHEKGAFTGAVGTAKGLFETADRGTLFLDEVGDLPLAAQVKLLRVVQEGEVVRVGARTPVKVDVRILAATHRSLSNEILSGRFREDLFYRLAVAVLQVPALRDRPGDLGLLIDRFLDQVNQECSGESGFTKKKISPSARNLLLNHPWPGNVRELMNTLRRAAIWSDGDVISAEDLREALLPVVGQGRSDAFDRPLGGGFSLPALIREVARHYLERAMDEARGNKTKAAELTGLPSYQTLSNWLEKYEVDK